MGATTAFGLDLWRFIAGIGIGVELVIGTYLSEPAPKQIRGRAFAWPHTRDLALETISN